MVLKLFFIFLLHFEISWTSIPISENDDAFCTSQDCMAEVSMLKWSMDETVDPCTDFYQYACGGYMNRTILHPGQYAIDPMTSIGEKVDKKLKKCLENPVSADDSEVTVKVKDFYTSCMDTERLEFLGIKPLQQLFERVGQWPVLNKENPKEQVYDWFSILVALNKEGIDINSLFQLNVEPDSQELKHFFIQFSPAKIEEGHLNMLLKGWESFFVKTYFKKIVDTAVRFGADETYAKGELLEIVKFEVEIAQIVKESTSYEGEKLTISELMNITGINWLKYINEIFPTEIKGDRILNVLSPYYFKSLVELLDETPDRVIVNYIMWSVIKVSSLYLDSRSRKLYHKLNGEFDPKDERWETCLAMTTKQLSLAVGYLYVQNYVDPDVKLGVQHLVEDLRQEFQKIIEETTWMDEKTRENAIEKVLAISKYIAYPEEFLNDELIRDFFADLNVCTSDFFSNYLSAKRHNLRLGYTVVNYHGGNMEWYIRPEAEAATVNAYYYAGSNSIYVPGAFLQDVYYGKNRPKYMTYGSTGWVIGHELTHGFDSSGKFYDKEGDYKNWWDAVTDKKYGERAQCLKDQYANLTLPETGQNGNSEKTIGEDIADNGGIKEAYNAYETWVSEHGPEALLPNLDLTQKQLFWLSAGSIWCQKTEPFVLRYQRENDEHSPSRFRVNGVAMNSPAFAEDFNCPVGAPMNPENRCSVW